MGKRFSFLSYFSHFSWHENDKDKDPRRSGKSGGPPELDELFKNAQQWLLGLLGGKNSQNKGNGGNWNSNGNGNKQFSAFNIDQQGKGFLIILAFIFILLLGIIGFYKVEPGEQAVQYRFGKYIGTTGPGPHWLFPGIYTKEIINTSVVHQKNFEEDLITKEVDLVTVAVAVQYRINHVENYLFKVRSAEESLTEATKSAIRQVVAASTLEQVLSTRGSTDSSFMGEQIKNLIDQNLKYYQAGLEIEGVEILSVMPPQQVKEAFNDAIQAQEDEIRYQNEAEAYERKIVPVAEGNAARILQDANTYVAQTVLSAEGNTAKFNAILPEYSKAPQVTRNRLYLDTMENTLKNMPKIFVDSKSNNVLLLPLDKLNMSSVLKAATDKANNSSQELIAEANSSMHIQNSQDNQNGQNLSDLGPSKTRDSRFNERNTEVRSWRN